MVTDDNVVVTATLVSHYDVYPAFGFRFDLTKSGVSVTFSGLPDSEWTDAIGRHYSGKVTVARDGQVFAL